LKKSRTPSFDKNQKSNKNITKIITKKIT